MRLYSGFVILMALASCGGGEPTVNEPNPNPLEEETVETVTMLLGNLTLERIAQSSDEGEWSLQNAEFSSALPNVDGYEIYINANQRLAFITSSPEDFSGDRATKTTLSGPNLRTEAFASGDARIVTTVSASTDGISGVKSIYVTDISDPTYGAKIDYENLKVSIDDTTTGDFLMSVRTTEIDPSFASLNGIAEITDFKNSQYLKGSALITFDVNKLTGIVSITDLVADNLSTIQVEAIETPGNAAANFSVDTSTGLLTGYSQFNLYNNANEIENGIHVGTLSVDGSAATGVLRAGTIDGFYAVADPRN